MNLRLGRSFPKSKPERAKKRVRKLLRAELLEDRRLLALAPYIPTDQQLAFASFAADSGPFAAEISLANPNLTPSPISKLLINGQPDPDGGTDPDWSRDGTEMIFSRPSQELWIVNAFTGKMLPVLDADGAAASGLAPVWVGGDTSRISWIGSEVDRLTNSHSWEIMHAELTILEDSARVSHVINVTSHPLTDFNPSWSPDGSKLIFQSDRSGRSDIYLIEFKDADGFGPPKSVNLTANRDLAGDFNPEFSPDGESIVFVSSTGNSDLWLMDADGQNQRQLSTSPVDEFAPTWSPDGSEIAYSARLLSDDGSSDSEIMIISSDGTRLRQITDNTQFDQDPSWRVKAVAPVDLALSLAPIGPQRQQHQFEYALSLKNRGVDSESNVIVQIEADHRIAIDRIRVGPGATVSINGSLATIRILALDDGASFPIFVEARAREAGSLSFTATVAAAIDRDPRKIDNRLTHQIAVSPSNDDFSKAQSIGNASGDWLTSNYFASLETSIHGVPEPAHARDAANRPITGGNSVWFQWSAFRTGEVTFNTLGSNFDTLLAAYTLSSDQTPRLLEMKKNDDAAGTSSKINFNASGGSVYYVAVDGYRGQTGRVQLNWSQEVEPANPPPQRVQSLSVSSVLAGSGNLPLVVRGSGFRDGASVYVYDANEPVGSNQHRTSNFLATTRIGSDTLEVTVPSRLLASAGTLRIVVIRGTQESNAATLQVASQQPLPSGTSLVLDKIRLIADYITRLASGAGEGESTEEVYSLEGHVQFNDYLAVNGASIEVRINRAANSLRISVRQGEVILTNLPRYGDVPLWSGRDFEFSVDGSGQLTNLLRETVQTPLREKGIQLTIDRAQLLLGATNDSQGRPIYGIEIYGSVEFQQLFGVISVPVRFEKFILSQNEGLRFGGELGPLSFGVTNLLRLEEVYLSFEPGLTPASDRFRGRGRIVTPIGINAEGNIEVQGGRLNSIGGEIELPDASGVPIGPINLVGGGLGIENLLNPSQLRLTISADATILHSAVAKVLRLDDVQLYYQLPASFGGQGSLQIMQVEAARASIDLDLPNSIYKFGGNVTLVPDFPIFIVRGELSASVKTSPQFKIQMSGYAEGTVQIPDGTGGIYDVLKACGTIPLVGIKVGPCLRFPITLLSAKIAYQNDAFSFSTDIPIVGKITTQIKQLKSDVQASIELFNNIGKVRSDFRFGGSGEGETASKLIGTVEVAADSPKLIVSVQGGASVPAYELLAPDGTRLTADNAAQYQATYFFNEQTMDSIYVIENPQTGIWSAVAEASVTDILGLEAWGVNAPPELNDLLVLSTSGGYDISYRVEDVDDDARVSLYYSTSSTLTNGQLIVDDLLESRVQQFRWNANDGSVPSGNYFLYALADDGVNMPVSLFSPFSVQVVDSLAPLPPESITVVANQENSIQVDWPAVTDPELAGYQIWYGEELGESTIINRVDAGLTTVYTLSGLKSQSTYRVSVVSYDRTIEANPFNPAVQQVRNRFSLPTEPTSVTTGTSVPPVVQFKANVTNKLIAGTDLKLQWTVENDEDLAVQQLYASTDDGQSFVLLSELAATARDYSFRLATVSVSDSLHFKLLARDTSGNEHTVSSESYSINSPGILAFGSAATQIDERAGVAKILVRRSGGSFGEVSAQIVVQSGTATAGNDFENTIRQVTFSDGETEQLVAIAIRDDGIPENDETIIIGLRWPESGVRIELGTSHAITIINDDFILDSDGDGVLDSIENLAPNGGDGNGDGTADAQQSNVAFVASNALGNGFTIVANSGQQLQNVHIAENTAAIPAYLQANTGAVSFVIAGVTVGSVTSYRLILQAATPIDAYLHYSEQWFWFGSNGSVGARFQSTGVEVTLQDGSRGDADRVKNGSVNVIATVGKSIGDRPYQNKLRTFDTNADGSVSAIDALLIINKINIGSTNKLVPPALPLATPFFFMDPSGDDFITALDALLVINFLNSNVGGEGEFARLGNLPLQAYEPLDPSVPHIGACGNKLHESWFFSIQPSLPQDSPKNISTAVFARESDDELWNSAVPLPSLARKTRMSLSQQVDAAIVDLFESPDEE